MTVRVFTDSTCDLTPKQIATNYISVVPLYVAFAEQTYQDGREITPAELFAKVDQYGKLPKTSAPSPADFQQAFQPWIDAGNDIVYIGLSSQLSSTIQNARIAAAEFPAGRVEVVDSLNVSTGIGLLVLRACDLVRKGNSVKAIAQKLRTLVPKVRTTLIIDTLDYLYKGGRCSALQNIIGGILKVKPIVRVVDGKVVLGQKLRGNRDIALSTLIKEILSDKDNIDPSRVMVTHAMCPTDAVRLKNQLEQNLPLVTEVSLTDAGCVISSHCGPKTVGILYIAK